MIDYFITSLVISLLGLALVLFPPKKRTDKYGYRSKTAMSSQEKWDRAQKLAGQYLTVNGISFLVTSFLLYKYLPSDYSRLSAVILPVLGVFLSTRIIEKRLNKNSTH